MRRITSRHFANVQGSPPDYDTFLGREAIEALNLYFDGGKGSCTATENLSRFMTSLLSYETSKQRK